VKKILVIRFSSIGDLVLTTPVIRCLHRQWGAEVHLLTKPAFAGLMRPNPYLARIHTLDADRSRLIATLRNEGYDLVVDLHKNLRSLRFRLALGRPSIAFDKLNAEKWLRVRLGWDILPPLHLVDRYFRALRPLGVVYDGEGLDHFIPPEEEVDPARWLGPDRGAYVAVALGAAHATKQIPEDKLREILAGLPLPALLIGGPAEQALGASLAALSGGPVRINLAGALTLHQSASVLRQALAVLSPDTGMMHIAAALRRPLVSVWGNTIPAFGMYPFYPEGQGREQRFEVRGLACRPCSKLGAPVCPRGHFRCMRDQPAAAIARSLAQIAIPEPDELRQMEPGAGL
jgi:ADP-heptose:LPS heptosyltransferase